MITIRKLGTLPRKTALRKAAVLLQGFEVELRAGRSIDTRFLEQLLELVFSGAEVELSRKMEDPRWAIRGVGLEGVLRACNGVRHLLLGFLGNEAADWDLMPLQQGQVSPGGGDQRRILPLRVFLEDIRSPFNVGSIFRIAESFCVESITLTPACPKPDHQRARRSAMGCADIVPWVIGDLGNIAQGETVFALELGGTSLQEFEFPADGSVIIGNEELGLSPEARQRADRSAGRVSIPLHGVKGSLNVSAAFAILMHTWCVRVLSF